MKKRIFFFIFLIVYSLSTTVHCLGQTPRIDSLLTLIKKDNADTNKLIHLYYLSDEYETEDNYTDGLIYGKQALELADALLEKPYISEEMKCSVKKHKARAHNVVGVIFSEQGNYTEALKNYFAALKIKEELADKIGVASSYNNIGIIYDEQGNYEGALKNHFASLKIKEELGDKKGMSKSYNNIGNVYYAQHNYEKALQYFQTSLQLKDELGDKKGIATAYNNIGNVYYDEGGIEKDIELQVKKYDLALKNYRISLKIKEELGDKTAITSSYNNIGNVFTKQKKYKEAEEYLIKARKLSEEIGHKEFLRDTYNGLTKLYSAKGNYKEAFESHKSYILYRDSIDNEESRKKTIQTQMTYDFEKKEAIANAEHKKELENQEAIAEEKSRKQKVIIAFVVCGLLLVLIFAGFIFRSLRITRKQKNIIETQKSLVEQQKMEVEYQKQIVEEHQKDIIDSITYARRIQRSLLPTEKYIEKNLSRLMKK